jgi:hypothetical protein
MQIVSKKELAAIAVEKHQANQVSRLTALQPFVAALPMSQTVLIDRLGGAASSVLGQRLSRLGL